ncbi:unnamed protein product [Cuscuta epithymum]|uniref:Uncharacterized protein n=1 Tax=Cuscuta epithymum TaxID=186058 RepID=A0AAV0F297_9ASTE|nr:unnamed protein product [Cuscuta epithymum]
MDAGGFWDLDLSTPVTLDGQARPVPGDPLPLGLSRGHRLSRTRQVDFFQRFMLLPFVPSLAACSGFLVQRAISLNICENWITTLLGQLNVQKLISSIRNKGPEFPLESSWLQTVRKHLNDKSLYALNIGSEILLTPEDMLLVSYTHGDDRTHRRKAVLHHKASLYALHNNHAWLETACFQIMILPLRQLGLDCLLISLGIIGTYHLLLPLILHQFLLSPA